jgi:two-component system cell cycle response regulator DivK
MRPFAFVIDDNRLIANSLCQMLDLMGFDAKAAYGAPGALQVLSQNVPDLILMDIHIQGINGVELCRYIRREERLARIPVLAISSDTQETMINDVRAAGANGFLAKPIDFEALEKAILRVTRSLDATVNLSDKRDAPPQAGPRSGQ